MNFSDQDAAARDIWLGNICHSFGDTEDTQVQLTLFIRDRLGRAGLSGIDTLEVNPPENGTSTGYLSLRDVNEHAVAIDLLRVRFGQHRLQVAPSRRLRNALPARRIVRIESLESMDLVNRRIDNPRRVDRAHSTCVDLLGCDWWGSVHGSGPETREGGVCCHLDWGLGVGRPEGDVMLLDQPVDDVAVARVRGWEQYSVDYRMEVAGEREVVIEVSPHAL